MCSCWTPKRAALVLEYYKSILFSGHHGDDLRSLASYGYYLIYCSFVCLFCVLEQWCSIYVCVCVYVCVYIYIDIDIDTHVCVHIIYIYIYIRYWSHAVKCWYTACAVCIPAYMHVCMCVGLSMCMRERERWIEFSCSFLCLFCNYI